jgi:hypothetical protein
MLVSVWVSVAGLPVCLPGQPTRTTSGPHRTGSHMEPMRGLAYCCAFGVTDRTEGRTRIPFEDS